MKYIKEYNKHLLYQEVTLNVGSDRVDSDGLIMSDKNINLLLSVLPFTPDITHYKTESGNTIKYIQCAKSKNYLINDELRRNRINYIIELKDEYFIVPIVSNGKTEDYICDTTQGVIDLLKDKKLI
jgi:hypothetical protein